MINITDCGNTEVPAYLALQKRGYAVTCSDDGRYWTAASGNCKFSADNPVSLLGIAAMYETRGEEWKASDEEIECFIEQFDVYVNGKPEA
jgi:hypothetical protein